MGNSGSKCFILDVGLGIYSKFLFHALRLQNFLRPRFWKRDLLIWLKSIHLALHVFSHREPISHDQQVFHQFAKWKAIARHWKPIGPNLSCPKLKSIQMLKGQTSSLYEHGEQTSRFNWKLASSWLPSIIGAISVKEPPRLRPCVSSPQKFNKY